MIVAVVVGCVAIILAPTDEMGARAVGAARAMTVMTAPVATRSVAEFATVGCLLGVPSDFAMVVAAGFFGPSLADGGCCCWDCRFCL